jgi:HEAT repeat protein
VAKAALHAIRQIGSVGEPALLEELRQATDPGRVRFLLGALSHLRSPATQEAYIEQTRHADLYVRRAAYSGLIKQGHDEAFRRAIQGLKDDFWTVRESVLQYLVNAGKPCLGVLIEEMGRQDPITARHIEIVLQRITGESFGSDQPAWQRWWIDNRESLLLPATASERS